MHKEFAISNSIAKKFPFLRSKVPVCQGVIEFKKMIKKYSSFSICPYLAYKDKEGWSKSTSRVYMNQVLPNFLYIPVNIVRDDNSSLGIFFDTIRGDQGIVAVNITQPHKSNSILMDEFAHAEVHLENIDTLIRDERGKLVPFDLNAPSFMGWYSDEVGTMDGKTIVLIGVGGVGEPLARRFAESKPAELILVDPNDKTKVAKRLKEITAVSYKPSIQRVETATDNGGIVVINAAGKEGATAGSGLEEWLKANTSGGGVFVDLRPHLNIDIVEKAKKLGWKSYTGYGMNARNDYSLLTGIAKVMGVTPLAFKKFKKLVAAAS